MKISALSNRKWENAGKKQQKMTAFIPSILTTQEITHCHYNFYENASTQPMVGQKTTRRQEASRTVYTATSRKGRRRMLPALS